MKRRGLLPALITGACVAGCAGHPSELPADVWGRHDAPPTGVRHPLLGNGALEACSSGTPGCVNGLLGRRYAVGASDAVGAAVCADATSPAREIRIDRRPSYTRQRVTEAGDPELGETLEICPRGFDLQTRPVTLTLRRSDGSAVTRRVAPNAEALASDTVGVVALFLNASWPVGPVAVTARQGTIVRRRSFRIVAPRHRGVRVQEWLGRPILPNPLKVMVVGQRRRSSVLVDLYRSQGARSQYATSFSIATDERGVGQLRVPYGPRDNGAYLLRPRNAGASGGRDVEARVRIGIGDCQSEPRQNAYCAN